MRILFISSTRIGDAVFTTGVLNHLLRTHPHAQFTIACGSVAEGVFARMPRLERTLLIEKQPYDRHWLKLWRQTVGTAWDLIVDLRGSALSFLLYARRRVVYRGGALSGHKIEQLAGLLGIAPAPLPTCWVGPDDCARAQTLLPVGPLIGLAPTANSSFKTWAPERFADLFNALREQLPGARPVVFAGPGTAERAMAAPLLAVLPDAVDLCGRLTLPEASACIMRCALFIGHDSGLTHLAAATSTPTLGLYGPTSARGFSPAGRRTAVALAEGAPGVAAMANLSVPAALQAARGLLAA